MKKNVVIIHGWSDRSKSFSPLAQKLNSNGLKVYDVWLADYFSMEDDVTLLDVAKTMESVFATEIAANRLTVPFDMIVHSTGALVARQWLVAFDQYREQRYLRRLVMLAPANFGSSLAQKGRSFIGRVSKGLNNWFQTGTEMLKSLELSSPTQWRLVLSDLLAAGEDTHLIYSAEAGKGCMPFVITGIKGYSRALRSIVNENGADGTIRASAANLNAYGATLDFSKNEASPNLEPWHTRDNLSPYCFRVLKDEDHSSIVKADGKDTLNLIFDALACETEDDYRRMQSAWSAETDAIEDLSKPETHRFFMLNTFVVDDMGNPVDDYFIEFFAPDHEKNSIPMTIFHSKVVEHVHQNDEQKACRCFYLDRTNLEHLFYPAISRGTSKELLISISASPPGPNARYFLSTKVGAAGFFPIHMHDDIGSGRWLRRYSTHFLKIIIPRYANTGVFKVAPFI